MIIVLLCLYFRLCVLPKKVFRFFSIYKGILKKEYYMYAEPLSSNMKKCKLNVLFFVNQCIYRVTIDSRYFHFGNFGVSCKSLACY